jgi:AcrR family transcriptional regulator
MPAKIEDEFDYRKTPVSTENHILRNARILLLKYGVRLVSQDDVAAQCGASINADYRYLNYESLKSELNRVVRRPFSW